MDLQASIRTSGDITILDLQGRATIGVGNDLLSSHLRMLIDGGSRKLLLNLADLTQVDSSGISTIVGTFFTPRRTGSSLKLLRPRRGARPALRDCFLGGEPFRSRMASFRW